MTEASDPEERVERLSRKLEWRRRSVPMKVTATFMALLGVGLLAAGCGGKGSSGASGSSSGSQLAQGVAYASCMRSHAVSNFPDPTLGPGGGVTFQGTFDQKSSSYQAAAQACRSLRPGGGQVPPATSQKLGAEVKWAQCMRTHGVPGFPDPNAQGAFDSSKFDSTSSAFQSASQACKSLEPTGVVQAVPGPG